MAARIPPEGRGGELLAAGGRPRRGLASRGRRATAVAALLAAACGRDVEPPVAGALHDPAAPRDLDPFEGAAEAPAGDEGAELAREAETIRAGLAAAARRRDRLLGRVARLERTRGLPDRLLARWRLRAARGELEEVVAELQRLQARLLVVEARNEARAGAAAERDWERIEQRLQRAAAAWEAGGVDPAAADTALARELLGSADGASHGRYRVLVERLARVNARLEETLPLRAPPGEGPAALPGFLDVDDRGPASAVGRDAWLRLRTELAREIVAVASEVTRRGRHAP